MAIMMNRRALLVSAVAATALPAPYALANTTTVEMLNKHPSNAKLRNVFTPRLLTVDPGQTVLFQATDKGHNSASIKGMIPEGGDAWKGKIGAGIEITFDVPGFYGYVCTPHASLGMVGLVVVRGDGMLNNLEAAQSIKHRGKAKAVFEEIWAHAKAEGLLG